MKRVSINSFEMKNIGFNYGAGEMIFTDVNYVFNPGEVLFIQGPQGAGKNTLIKLMLGLLSPTQGDYLVNGTSVNQFSYAEFDPIRLNIGYSFDVGGLINNQSLYENMMLLLNFHNFIEPSKRFDHIVNLLARFQIDEHKHLRPSAVSSSIRKMAVVLRAFLLHPEIVILDNPTQGISVEMIPAFMELIEEHRQKHNLKHIIISSDDKNLINQLGGRVMHVTRTGLLEESRQ
ncbi:MAG TPA: ATP-binding cassette domain-containing protein [Bacteriovoracaceae bacterium]|nr:ATP-binding cassette domain-containing protein [Bacteriovoracaceae bacterium]